jgi:hypothetical protein
MDRNKYIERKMANIGKEEERTAARLIEEQKHVEK